MHWYLSFTFIFSIIIKKLKLSVEWRPCLHCCNCIALQHHGHNQLHGTIGLPVDSNSLQYASLTCRFVCLCRFTYLFLCHPSIFLEAYISSLLYFFSPIPLFYTNSFDFIFFLCWLIQFLLKWGQQYIRLYTSPLSQFWCFQILVMLLNEMLNKDLWCDILLYASYSFSPDGMSFEWSLFAVSNCLSFCLFVAIDYILWSYSCVQGYEYSCSMGSNLFS